MKTLRGIGCAMVWAVAGLSVPAHADVDAPKNHVQTSPSIVKSSDDIISSLPVLSKIPRSFIVGDGFRIKMTGMELRIDHMGSQSNSAGQKRNCMVGFSYATPVSFFGSRVDVPLFHAENLRASDWGMNTPGDYVLHFSKDATVQHPTMGLMASARF